MPWRSRLANDPDGKPCSNHRFQEKDVRTTCDIRHGGKATEPEKLCDRCIEEGEGQECRQFPRGPVKDGCKVHKGAEDKADHEPEADRGHAQCQCRDPQRAIFDNIGAGKQRVGTHENRAKQGTTNADEALCITAKLFKCSSASAGQHPVLPQYQ